LIRAVEDFAVDVVLDLVRGGIPPPYWRGPAIAFQRWIRILRRWGVAVKGIEHPWSIRAVKGVKGPFEKPPGFSRQANPT
jgi:hypothetical protein